MTVAATFVYTRMADKKIQNLKGSSVTTSKGAGEANPTDAAQGETHTGPLRMGKEYEGVIVNGDNASGVYTVRVGDRPIEGCYWVAGIACGLLGFKTHMIPTRGTKVTMVYGNPSLITHALPTSPRDDVSGSAREMNQGTGSEGRKGLDAPDHSDFAGANRHDTPPKDLFEGELDIENHLGVALRMLHTMASLSAGDRAKIEAFVVNDMVRIVSDVFKHVSAFGDMQIYNDGRLNVRFDGTSYEHEAWSLFGEEEAKADVSEFQIAPEEDLVKTGRWRFSQYIGWLGEFVHQFVTEPSETASSIAEEAYRPGKSRIQQMGDGSILMQSVADVSIERVCRVQVPVEVKRWDDPEGVVSKAFKSLDKSYLKLWNYKENTLHHMAYQLREYSRWLSCYHSFARFHQMAASAGEWEVPAETLTEHVWTNQEKDVEQSNAGVEVLIWDTYSCIRLMRDGSIVLWDGYGNGITMGKSGVQLSAVDHFEIDAGGDIRLTAGSDIILKARRNIEIVAVCGGLILKAMSWFKGLCEKGVLWLKSDADDPDVDDTTTNERGSPPKDYPDYEKYDYSVLIESSKGRVGLRSERTMCLIAEGEPDGSGDQTDVTASILLQSRFQDVRVYGQRNALLKSQGANQGVAAVECTQGIVLDSPKLLSTAYVFDVRFSAGDEDAALTFKGGKLNVRQVAAKFVGASDRLAGPERGAQPDGTPPPGCCLPPHFNHVDKADAFDEPEFGDGNDLQPRTNYEDSASRNPLAYETMFDTDPTWAFPEAADYRWPNESSEAYPRQEPLAQQRVAFDPDYTDRTEEYVWNTLDVLQTAPRTNSANLPYPGRSVQEMYHPDSAGDPLHEPLDGEYSAQNVETALRQRQPKRRYRKRNES